MVKIMNLYDTLNNTENENKLVGKIETDKIKETFQAVTVALYDFYKSGKGTENIETFINANIKDIEYLSNNIKAESVTCEKVGNYIKINLDGFRLGQLSLGNKKLAYNEFNNSGFVLWSILGGITCHGATSLCKSYCYNNSKSFTTTLLLKSACTVLSLLSEFEQIMINAIKLSPYKITVVRIHEDGDFYNMEYFKKWQRVSDNLENMIFGAYTKNAELLPYCQDNKNFTMRFSVMHDTNDELKEFIKKNGALTYTVIGTKRNDERANAIFENIPSDNQCINDCRKCKKCYFGKQQNLYNKLH